MQNKHTLYIVGILILIFGCKSPEKRTTEINSTDESNTSNNIVYDMSWIEGEWVDSTKFGFKNLHYHEIWRKIDSTRFSCSKFSSKDYIENESTLVNLIKNQGSYYYSFDLNNKQVTYYSDSLSEKYIRLINQEDKFPQTLEYSKIEDTLFISLSGMAGGVFRNPIYKALKK